MSSKAASTNVQRKKKRSKAYYIGSAKRQKVNSHVLEVNQKGFFITTNNTNSRANVNEAYALLGQYADNLHGPEQYKKEDDHVTEPSGKDVDVEAQIAAEIECLKKVVTIGERRFQAVDCGIKNCVFIRTQLEDPCDLAFKILDDIRKTKESRARYMCRLIPVTVTCRAFVDDIAKAAETLLPKYFDEKAGGAEGKTYSIIFKARCNKNVIREAVYDALNPIVQRLNSANTVELKTPQLVIIVEVMAKICCLSVIKEYFELKKYNVAEMATPTRVVVAAASKATTAALYPPEKNLDPKAKVPLDRSSNDSEPAAKKARMTSSTNDDDGSTNAKTVKENEESDKLSLEETTEDSDE